MASNIFDNRCLGHKIDRNRFLPTGTANNATSRIRSVDDKEEASKSENSTVVSRCNIRERLIHLLALRPYNKLELISRLQEEGIRNYERSSINSILMAIAQLRNQMYSLRAHMWYYVNENWRFYTEEEQCQVKWNKPQDITPPHNSTDGSSRVVSKSVNSYEVSCCHIRERLIQLLALKPFSKLELISRLQKEGIRDHDRLSINSILMDIASVCNNVYSLRRHMWEDVNANWPFYTENEQNQVERNKPQNLTSSHNSNDGSSRGSLSPTSILTPSPSPQIDSLEFEYLPASKKRRISLMGPNSKHVVVSSNPIDNKIGNGTTHFSGLSTKKSSTHQDNLYTYPSGNTNRVFVSSSSSNSNSTTNNSTYCSGHSTKKDSKDKVKNSSRNNGDIHKPNNGGKLKQQQTQPSRDLSKKNESLTESTALATKKSYTLIDLFGKDSPSKRVPSDRKHKKNPSDYNLQRQTQSQKDLSKKKESLTESVSPAAKKEYKMIDLFGEDLVTPAKRSFSDRETWHKKKFSDLNLQRQIQPQLHLSRKSETSTKSASPAKKNRMIELFGED